MFGGDILARRARDLLETWSEHTTGTALAYLFVCIFLVLFAGLMSGLTLGLMSMDIVELEVLRRSGSDVEARQAANIIPVVKDAHFLLVTLLLCNAIAMEALPIFLDKLMQEWVAILVSVTAVLFAGEIFPQAICSKYGLVIGSFMAWPVRVLMLFTSPISYPIAKLLDFVLGGEHASLFRRKQLKALVTLHARDEGFGGRLTADEIQIITGALDLTRKTAFEAMTPLDKVFMLSTTQKLDDATVSAVMASKPFSRLPVYKGDNRQDIVGVILVKELLEYVKNFPDSTVSSSMKIRQLPRLSADTPMYDLLKLFRVGRSHMALLTQPYPDPSDATTDAGLGDANTLNGMVRAYRHDHHAHGLGPHGTHPPLNFAHGTPLATVPEVAAGVTSPHAPGAAAGAPPANGHPGGAGADGEEREALLSRQLSTSSGHRAGGKPAAAATAGAGKGLLSTLMAGIGLGAGAGSAEERQPMLGGPAAAGGGSSAAAPEAEPEPAGGGGGGPLAVKPAGSGTHLASLARRVSGSGTGGTATPTAAAGSSPPASSHHHHHHHHRHKHGGAAAAPEGGSAFAAAAAQAPPPAAGSAFLVHDNLAFDLSENGAAAATASGPLASPHPDAELQLPQHPEMRTISTAAAAAGVALPAGQTWSPAAAAAAAATQGPFEAAAGVFTRLSSGAVGGGGGGLALELEGNLHPAGGSTPGRSRSSLRSLFGREAAAAAEGPDVDLRSVKVNRKRRGSKKKNRRRSSNSPVLGGSDHAAGDPGDLEAGGLPAAAARTNSLTDTTGGGGGEQGAGSVTNLTAKVNRKLRTALSKAFVRSQNDGPGDGGPQGGGGEGALGPRAFRGQGDDSSSSSDSTSSSDTGSSRDDLEDMLPVPLIAKPGEPIGIITIEDVIEELMGIEILDETDRWMDNEQSVPVNTKGLEADLPDHLRDVLAVAERAKNQVLAPVIDRQSWLLQAAATVTGGVSTAQAQTSGGLASIAGSMLRSAFGGDPLAAAVARARANSREKMAGVSPVRGGRAPSPPKRGGDGAAPPAAAGADGSVTDKGGGGRWTSAFKGSGGLGSTSMPLAGGSGGSVTLPGAPGGGGGGGGGGVQRSDIRAAALVAAHLGGGGGGGAAGGSPQQSFANWKALERLKASAGAGPRGQAAGVRPSAGVTPGGGASSAGIAPPPAADGSAAP